jgi:hypothetical protein
VFPKRLAVTGRGSTDDCEPTMRDLETVSKNSARKGYRLHALSSGRLAKDVKKRHAMCIHTHCPSQVIHRNLSTTTWTRCLQTTPNEGPCARPQKQFSRNSARRITTTRSRSAKPAKDVKKTPNQKLPTLLRVMDR